MMISGHVIAKCLYATGLCPFVIPHRRNYVPAGHLPPTTLLFFPFPAAWLIHSLRHATRAKPTCHWHVDTSKREAILHVAREFTVVAGPISDRLYIEVNALDVSWLYH